MKPYASATESSASFLTQPCSVCLQLEHRALGSCVLAGGKVITQRNQENSTLGIFLLSVLGGSLKVLNFLQCSPPDTSHPWFASLGKQQRWILACAPQPLTCFRTCTALFYSHYMVVFPAVIQQSHEEKLYIHFSSLSEAVHLAVTLLTKTRNHTLVEQDVEKPGTFKSITFQVSVEVATDLTVNAFMFTQLSSSLGTLSFSLPEISSRLSIFPYQCQAKYNSVLESRKVENLSCVEKKIYFFDLYQCMSSYLKRGAKHLLSVYLVFCP